MCTSQLTLRNETKRDGKKKPLKKINQKNFHVAINKKIHLRKNKIKYRYK